MKMFFNSSKTIYPISPGDAGRGAERRASGLERDARDVAEDSEPVRSADRVAIGAGRLPLLRR